MTEQTETTPAPRQHSFSDLEPLKRWEPLRTVMDRFFADFPESWPQTSIASQPSVDITETDGEYRVHAELPGVSKDDVTVELEEGRLCIRGEKKSKRDEKTERGRRLECSYGAFSRTFSLPQDADSERISAEYKDGVLDIAIKKSPESKPKRVAIKG